MARVDVTKTTAPGTYPLDGVVLTQEAADITDKNQFTMSADDLLIAYNSGAADPHTVTITSSQDAMGRTKHIEAESLAAGVWKMYGPFKRKAGWVQTAGKLHFEGDHAEILFSVIKGV